MAVLADTRENAIRRALELDRPTEPERAAARRSDVVERCLAAVHRALNEHRNELAILLCLSAVREADESDARIRDALAVALGRVRCLRVVPDAHAGGAHSVAWSPDAQLVASGGADARVRLWKGDRLAPIASLDGHEGRIRQVTFNHARPLLSSCADDGTVIVWHAARHAELWRAGGGGASALAARFSPNGRRIAIAAAPERSGVRDAEGGDVSFTFARHDGLVVYDAVFSPNGRLVASCGDDGRAIVWRVSDGAVVCEVCHDRPARAVAFDAAGECLAVASYEGSFTLMRVSDGACEAVESPNGRGYGVRFVDEDRALWMVAEGGAQALCHVSGSAGLACRALDPHAGQILDACARRDGRVLASAGQDGATRVFVVENGEARLLDILQSAGAATFAVDLTRDARRAVTADADGAVRVWTLDAIAPRSAEPLSPGLLLDAAAGWLRASGRTPTQAELDALAMDARDSVGLEG